MLIDAPAFARVATDCVALVAVKRRALGKGRLAAVLQPRARRELVRSMLAHVVATAMSAEGVARCCVVSPERDLVRSDVDLIEDAGTGLNAALAHARSVCAARGARELLVLPADLPTLTPEELNVFVRAGRARGFAIASDAASQGTNALYLPADVPFRFQFGADSRRLHLREARRLGFTPLTIRAPGLQFDVDDPQDVERLAGLS